MAKKPTRFKKGQTVYMVSCLRETFDSAFKYIAIKAVYHIVERVVDSCGQKQMTFYNRGHDWLYGRSCSSDSPWILETEEEAREYAEAQGRAFIESTNRLRRHYGWPMEPAGSYEVLPGTVIDDENSVDASLAKCS